MGGETQAQRAQKTEATMGMCAARTGMQSSKRMNHLESAALERRQLCPQSGTWTMVPWRLSGTTSAPARGSKQSLRTRMDLQRHRQPSVTTRDSDVFGLCSGSRAGWLASRYDGALRTFKGALPQHRGHCCSRRWLHCCSRYGRGLLWPLTHCPLSSHGHKRGAAPVLTMCELWAKNSGFGNRSFFGK